MFVCVGKLSLNTSMKEVKIEKTPLGFFDINKAFDIVFSDETLKLVHGDSLRVTPWNNDVRKLRFDIKLNGIPREVKAFFCGERLRVTNLQRRVLYDNSIIVNNKLKLHFFGAELFVVNPTFGIEYNDGISYVYGNIQHKVRLPYPINAIVETFMTKNSERELAHFERVIMSRLEIKTS